MKKSAALLVLTCLLLLSGCREKEPVVAAAGTTTSLYNITMKRDILCLMLAYPGYITGVARQGNSVYIVMKSKKQILYDDRKVKSAGVLLTKADLQDMMKQIYPLWDVPKLASVNYDPGRYRVYSLFYEVYGRSRSQIEAKLVNAKIGTKNYLFNRSNKASAALKNVMNELLPLTQVKKSIKSFVLPVNGTYNYRLIAGTNLLSAHSFGAAIDLAVSGNDYWEWVTRSDGQRRLSAYPREIVHIFEKHGFVWGGKWGHFDMMHYEYRPELLFKARFFAAKPRPGRPWYDGLPYSNAIIKKYITMLDKACSGIH